MTSREKYGENLRQYRKGKLHKTQQEFADECGYGVKTYREIEKGRRIINTYDLETFYRVFGITCSDIFPSEMVGSDDSAKKILSIFENAVQESEKVLK